MLRIEIYEPREVRAATGEACMVDDPAAPAAPANGFDEVPCSQILKPKGGARQKLRHRRSHCSIFVRI